jgi:hypothetical protein
MNIPVNKNTRRGAALVTLMVVILIVSIAGAAMVGFAKQQAYSITRVRDYLKAQAYAEAGANAAYNVIKTNFADASDPSKFPAVAFGDGGYDVTVTVVGDDQASIVAVGQCGNATITVKADVKNMQPVQQQPSGPPVLPPDNPWGYSVLVNGYITHNGAGTAFGKVHVNNYLTQNGSIEWGSDADPMQVSCSGANGFIGNGSISIHGTIRAPQIQINGTEHVHQKLVQSVPTVPFPTLDLTPYYQIALANGQVFSSQSPNGDVNWGLIPGGVKWISGTFSQNGSLSYQGAIIATGNITFNGSVTQTKYQQLPAIISRDGYVKVNGSHQINGLVYAKGDCTWNGAGHIYGSILVGGNLTFNGSYGNIYYDFSQPSPDPAGGGGGSGVSDHCVITAWQQ